jgi:hypothetical protein
MKPITFTAGLLAFAATAAAYAEDLPQPIAEAGDGKLQCYSPNTAKKTCASLDGYRIDDDGMIVNTSTVLISPNPALTMQTRSIVTIKNSQVCGLLKREDLDQATFAANGKELNAKQADQIRQQIAQDAKNALGHEICTAYVPKGKGLIAKESDDGGPAKGQEPVIWVSPDEGYRVAP